MDNRMTPQTPAEGILKTSDWGDSISYYITCQCTDDVCSHSIEVEADDHSVTVHLYANYRTKFWEKSRWSQIWQILTKGYAEYQTTTMMSQQTAINYSTALTSASNDVTEFKRKRQNETV